MTRDAETASPLQRIRVSRGYTQEELASEAHVSRSVIQKMEKGVIPRSNIIRRLAAALGVEMDELLAPPDQIGPHGFTRDQVEAIYQRFREVDQLDHRTAIKRTRAILELKVADVPTDLGRNSKKHPQAGHSQ